MSKMNTAPMSGTRDFLPLDVLRRDYVIATIERVYQSYGFEPLETPALERLDTLLGKYGEEGDQLIFRALKRGQELQRVLDGAPTENTLADAGLRYDLTVPLARVVAEYRHRLPRIFKRYQIQPVYRADRPAKGRYREFYQCDVDIVGSASQTVEAEVIGAVAQILRDLGFAGPLETELLETDPNASEQPESSAGFAVRLNHRGVLRGLMEIAGVPAALEGLALVAIDKLDKIGLDGVRRELDERGLEPAAAALLLETMAEAPDTNAATLSWLAGVLEPSEAGRQGVADLRKVVEYAAYGPAAPHLRVDPYLTRGLSYYTGAVFEIAFPGFSGSGGGGGRYDNLIGMFSGQNVPACGFSLGLERILLLMEERGLFPERLAGQPQALVTRGDESTTGASLALAQRLRAGGLRVDLYPDADGYGKQFKYATGRAIRYALLLGARELERDVVAVKDLDSGGQEDVPSGEIVSWMSERV